MSSGVQISIMAVAMLAALALFDSYGNSASGGITGAAVAENALSVTVETGWNAIGAGMLRGIVSTTCSPEQIRHLAYNPYNPAQGDSGIYALDESLKLTDARIGDTKGVWLLNSGTPCQITAEVKSPDVVQLSSGWNLISIPPSWEGKKVQDVFSACKFQLAYLFDPSAGWGFAQAFSQADVGKGLFINVNGQCESSTPCTDSDDDGKNGGKDYFKKGTVKFGDVTVSDDCISSDNNKAEGSNILNEYLCTDRSYGSTIYTCPGNCKDGACTKPADKEIPKENPSIEQLSADIIGHTIKVTAAAKGEKYPLETLVLYTNYGHYKKSCNRMTSCSVEFTLSPEKDWKELRFIAVAYDDHGIESSGTRKDLQKGSQINVDGDKITIASIEPESVTLSNGKEQTTAKKGTLTQLGETTIAVSDIRDGSALIYWGKEKQQTVNLPFCGSQCGAKVCKPYEECNVVYDAYDNDLSACKLSAMCADCGDVLLKYPDAYKIKGKRCNSYSECLEAKDDFGESYKCNSGYLCGGSCGQLEPVIEKTEFADFITKEIKIKVAARGFSPLENVVLYTNHGKYEKSCNRLTSCSAEFTLTPKEDWKELKFVAVAYDDHGIQSSGTRSSLREGDTLEVYGTAVSVFSIDATNVLFFRDRDELISVRKNELTQFGEMNIFVSYNYIGRDNNALVYWGKGKTNTVTILPKRVIVIPESGTKDTVFQVKIEAESGFKLSLDLTGISDKTKSITLYDDGDHGDGLQNDGTFGNIIDVSNLKLKPGAYLLKLRIKKGSIVMEPPSAVFLYISEGKNCMELIPGHTDVNSNRANIVFVGAAYGSSGKFTEATLAALDLEGKSSGIFSQEPFRSNKDRFNFWYVNQMDSTPVDSINCLANLDKCMSLIKQLSSFCQLTNKYPIALFNWDYRSHAILGEIASISRGEPVAALHEFGHSFGNLHDEYLESNRASASTGKKRIDRNIFFGSANQCAKDSDFMKFKGGGCGKEGVIDCIKDYNSVNTEIKCVSGDFSCLIEIGCFEGAHYIAKGAFRSLFNSVMRSDNLAVKHNTPRAFGKVNERLICDQIKAVTGSAGGICSNG